MRAINSNCTSGSAGINIAVIEWWLRTSGLEDRVTEWAETADPKAFKGRMDFDVGRRLVELLPWIRTDFLRRVSEDPGISFVLALADGVKPGRTDFSASFEKLGAYHILCTEVGQALKRTGLFERDRKATPRTVVVKMAAARLAAFRAILPIRNARVQHMKDNPQVYRNVDGASARPILEFPDPLTVASLEASLKLTDLYDVPHDQEEAWKKALKELSSFLKRPDVDDQVMLDGLDVAMVTEVMEM